MCLPNKYCAKYVCVTSCGDFYSNQSLQNTWSTIHLLSLTVYVPLRPAERTALIDEQRNDPGVFHHLEEAGTSVELKEAASRYRESPNLRLLWARRACTVCESTHSARQCLQKVPLSKIQILHNLSADDITISDVYASVKKYQSLRLRRNRMLSGMHTICRILFDKRFMHSYSTPIHTINLTFAVHKLMKNFPILYAAQQQQRNVIISYSS